jgi:hypothetical protein
VTQSAISLSLASLEIPDLLIERGADQPYTPMLVGITFLSLLALLLFFIAGRRFAANR